MRNLNSNCRSEEVIDINFLVAAHTDVGIKKNTNQDSLCIKTANTNLGKVVLAVICDGMGGLSKGELASATLVKAYSDWFKDSFPQLLYNGLSDDILKSEWENIAFTQNERIMRYGESQRVNLGTTLTVLLMAKNRYYVLNIGDSRAYEISDTIFQITKDQTVVAREIERGNMTPAQAKVDPGRNVLLQCVGASKIIEPDFFAGEVKENAVYMLCSDGFRHEITQKEIFTSFNADILTNEDIMKTKAIYLVELNKQRLEQDNISVALIRTF
ncbi:PP2C family protein-serine/threonine phosphatase [Clostridium lacusfryxellense]|uniref:PP2C family protein-serine/threonine phosphatase n=1 Tax=Clostridium lacusfryxellense TaxID=205328 RepID=UPI001C0C740A|nr:PP2C family serine/threonine-protein phosphatase [Clostridium lacusfryxellense]MBU3112351.1 serine/threonine-protein phosphatase [Clostridium lacusfryxellense]